MCSGEATSVYYSNTMFISVYVTYILPDDRIDLAIFFVNFVLQNNFGSEFCLKNTKNIKLLIEVIYWLIQSR